jgi:hypothetical protein
VVEGLEDALLEPLGGGAGHEVREHLGVGVGGEGDALPLQPLAQGCGVVDDAVVHDGDLAVGRHVGVGVHVGGGAVGGPAGVGDAGGALEAGRDLGLQVTHPALGLDHLQARRLRRGDDYARRVVPAVLQALQALQEEGGDVTLADVTDDSAHIACVP